MNDTTPYTHFLELVKQRRTIRRFKPDPLPDECISQIIDAARWAPSGFHTQPWEFVVITKKELRDKVVAILRQFGPPIENPDHTATAPSVGRFDTAPVFIIAFCDWRARVGLPDAVQSSDARIESTFRTSMACAFLSMQLAATALGIASQWYSASSGEKAQEAIKNLVGIPENLRLFDMMVLGYAGEDPLRKEVRSLNSMIHYNNCGIGDFRSNDEVTAQAMKTKEWCFSAH
jgi:nitroreductase